MSDSTPNHQTAAEVVGASEASDGGGAEEGGDGGGAAAAAANEARKHNSGAADLEKVTDYAEEKEILSSSMDLEDAIAVIRNRQVADTAEKLAREKELAKVVISKEDVDLIVEELEICRSKAERTLREHHGDVVAALASLTN